MAKRRKPTRNPDHGRGLIKRLAEQLSNSEAALGEPQQQYTIMDFEVSWDYMPDPTVHEMTQADQDRMDEIYPFVHTEPQTVIQDLRELIALYPKVPCLRNWLINCLRFGSKAERQEAMELGQEFEIARALGVSVKIEATEAGDGLFVFHAVGANFRQL